MTNGNIFEKKIVWRSESTKKVSVAHPLAESIQLSVYFPYYDGHVRRHYMVVVTLYDTSIFVIDGINCKPYYRYDDVV